MKRVRAVYQAPEARSAGVRHNWRPRCCHAQSGVVPYTGVVAAAAEKWKPGGPAFANGAAGTPGRASCLMKAATGTGAYTGG